MIVGDKVSIEENTIINPDIKKVTFYMGDTAPDAEKFSIRGGDVTFNANIYMPKGKLKINVGKKNVCKMTGLYIVDKVESGENVTWNNYNCSSAPIVILRNRTSLPLIAETQQQIKLFPNPSSGNFSIRFSKRNVLQTTVQIINEKGMIVMQRTIASNSNIENLEFNMGNQSSGIYLVKILTGKEVVTQKLAIKHL